MTSSILRLPHKEQKGLPLCVCNVQKMVTVVGEIACILF